MNNESSFVPKILLCGDEAEFISRVGGQRPFKIVGHVQFRGALNGQKFDFAQDGNLLLNDKICRADELLKMIRSGGADFIVFNDANLCHMLSGWSGEGALGKAGVPRAQRISILEFQNLPRDNFYDLQADIHLVRLLKELSIKTLLDADAHLLKGQLFTKEPNDLTAIDCIYDGDFYPMKENIFCRVYKNFSECCLRHYDAALLSEKTPAEFDAAFYLLKDNSDLVITFARNGSELAKHIQGNKDKFKKVEVRPSFSGQWILCYRHTPPTDFAMYVVTHKSLPPEHIQTFPDGYKLIHAGRALGEDLGYPGDDTGDNISNLNHDINEMTALYWLWKNTHHAIIGLSHYRRFFFTANPKNFLTEQETFKLLEDHDIVVLNLTRTSLPWRDFVKRLSDARTFSIAYSIIRKNLMRVHPDYLNVFDYRMGLPIVYDRNMFVARKNVFDAYCEWLFSFMIDSTREVLRETSLNQLKGSARRMMGYFSEGMLTVWLIKNHLRVKEINMVTVPGL